MRSPLYKVVMDTLVERIASGAMPPGSMLPSEIQLGQELGVAQGTARKALSELEGRGLVQRVQGRGTFVTQRTTEDSLFRFFRVRRQIHNNHGGRVDFVFTTQHRQPSTVAVIGAYQGHVITA